MVAISGLRVSAVCSTWSARAFTCRASESWRPRMDDAGAGSIRGPAGAMTGAVVVGCCAAGAQAASASVDAQSQRLEVFMTRSVFGKS